MQRLGSVSSSPTAGAPNHPLTSFAGLRPRYSLPVLLLAVGLGFWFTIASSAVIAGFDSVLGLAVTTVPLALVTGYLAYRRDSGPEPTRDGFIDGAAGLLCLAVAFWLLFIQPGHDGWDYWAQRRDLVALELFGVAIALWLFGLAAVWRLRAALLVLVIGSPPALIYIQNNIAPVVAVVTSVVARPVTEALGVHFAAGDDPASFVGVSAAGGKFHIIIADVCSGLSAWVSVLLVGIPASRLFGLGWRKTIGWLAVGLVLATAGNLLRVVAVLYSAWRWGATVAVGTIHPYLGVAIIFCVFTILFFLVRPLPLTRATWSPGFIRTPVLGAILAVSLVAAIGDYGLLPFGSLPAGSTPGPDVTEPLNVAPVVPGYSESVGQEIDWQDLFGSESHSYVILYHPDSGLQGVTLQLVTTPDQGRLLAYTPEQCGVYHGEDVTGQRSVGLGRGQVGYLIDSVENLAPTKLRTARRLRFDVLYWYVPFSVGGRSWTARFTLIQDADAAASLPPGDGVAPGGAAWDRVDTSLVRLAKQMITITANHP